MSILEKLSLKNTGENKPVVESALKERSSNTHDNGGCCGGCGGTQEEES